MFAQERAQLVLKRHLPVMVFLTRDVLPNVFQTGLAHREICVTTLPFKISVVAPLFLQPQVLSVRKLNQLIQCTRENFQPLHKGHHQVCSRHLIEVARVCENPVLS